VTKRVYAKRYSQAVFEMALEKGELDRWQSDLQKIAGLSRNTLLVAWLHSPKLDSQSKARLIFELAGDIGPLALNLVHLLAARGRLGMAGDIADEYQQLLDKHRGIEHAEITTAIPLDDKDRQRLAKRLSAMVDKEVVLESGVDASLVGGIVVRIGDRLLDGSTYSKLQTLKREIKGVR